MTIRLIEKLNPKKDAVMQCHTQEGNITTGNKVKIDFTSLEISMKKIMALNCHVDDSAKGRYNMI